MLGNAIFIVILGILAWMDYKTKELSVDLLLMLAGIGMLLFLMREERDWWDLLGGMTVGAVLLLFAILTRERIGKGDGYLFLASGIYFGFWDNLRLLYISFLVAGAVSIVLLILKKCSRNEALPFVPFVLVADVFILGVMA